MLTFSSGFQCSEEKTEGSNVGLPGNLLFLVFGKLHLRFLSCRNCVVAVKSCLLGV